MANTLLQALQKAEEAQKRLAKNDESINKYQKSIERLKTAMVKDQVIVASVGANEMFQEFGFTTTESRIGALLFASNHVKASDDPLSIISEYEAAGKEYLTSLGDDNESK